jgi:hypothetical protein
VPHTCHDMLAAGAAHHLTYRQLDFWTAKGHLRLEPGPRGCGHDRRWRDGEAGIFATIGRLLRAGLTLDTAAQAARGHTHLAPGVTLLVMPPPPDGPPAPGTGWCTMRDGRVITSTDLELEPAGATS